jgi:hypothetical protein
MYSARLDNMRAYETMSRVGSYNYNIAFVSARSFLVLQWIDWVGDSSGA